uniref:Uncharacterized protein n=1 Tax=Hyaloperonospora arabidopsidis (strain Emoy2) TaxID=559515 RepID=M4BKU4_HYAAE
MGTKKSIQILAVDFTRLSSKREAGLDSPEEYISHWITMNSPMAYSTAYEPRIQMLAGSCSFMSQHLSSFLAVRRCVSSSW